MSSVNTQTNYLKGNYMPEIHFFGFNHRTKEKIYEVVARLKNNLAATTSTPDVAARILCEAEFVGHPTSLAVNAQFEDQPYILVQSSKVLESLELVTSLARMPNPVDIVEGATLRRFVAKLKPVLTPVG